MSYLHIDNLYKNQTVLQFKEVYVLEKVHGTSAHVAFDRAKPEGKRLHFFHGGSARDSFLALFDSAQLELALDSLGHERLTVYGEAYGGKIHRGQHQYGPDLRFVAFDVKHNDRWLTVPAAQGVADALGLEFVPWSVCRADVPILDGFRDAPCGLRHLKSAPAPGAWSEGIVIRPLQEWVDYRGNRVIAKHKRPEMRETKTPREVSPEALAVETDALRIADEWVTHVRLDHVLDRLRASDIDVGDISATGKVIAAMVEDVVREAAGEIVDSRPARKAIGARAAEMFKARVTQVPQ